MADTELQRLLRAGHQQRRSLGLSLPSDPELALASWLVQHYGDLPVAWRLDLYWVEYDYTGGADEVLSAAFGDLDLELVLCQQTIRAVYFLSPIRNAIELELSDPQCFERLRRFLDQYCRPTPVVDPQHVLEPPVE